MKKSQFRERRLRHEALEKRELLACDLMSTLSGKFSDTNHNFNISSISPTSTPSVSGSTRAFTLQGQLSRADGSAFGTGHGDVSTLLVSAFGSGVTSQLTSGPTLNTSDPTTSTSASFTLVVTAGLGTSDINFRLEAPGRGASLVVTQAGDATPNLSGRLCVNQSPIANADSGTSSNEDTINSVAAPGVLANDTDSNDDNSVDFVAGNLANGINGVTSVNGSAGNVNNTINLASGAELRLNANGSYDYDPRGAFDHLAAGASETDKFQYTIFDGFASSTATVTVTILGVNDAPVAVNDSYSTEEDTPLVVSAAQGLLKNDTDVDNPNTDLRVVLASVSAIPAAQGVLNVNSNGSFEFTPAQDFNGNVTFTYRTSDGSATSDNVATVSINVDSVIDAPRITGFSVDSGVLGDRITNARRITFVGTSEASVAGNPVTIQVFRDDTDALLATATADNLGNWTSTLSVAGESFTPDGTFAFYAVATNNSGTNPAADSQRFEITFDTTAPIVASNSIVSELRKTPLNTEVQFRFNEPDGSADAVKGFGLEDLSLQKNGSATNRLIGATGVNLIAGAGGTFESSFALNGLETVTQESGSYTLSLNSVGAGIEDIAGNLLSNSYTATFAVDVTAPTALKPTLTTTTIVSNLPVPVVEATTPAGASVSYQLKLTEQQFKGFANSVSVQLVDATAGTVYASKNLAIPSGAADNLALVLTETFTATLPLGQHSLKFNLVDAVGNTGVSPSVDVFVNQVGSATLAAPNTPVFTTTYDVQTAINRALGLAVTTAVQPWQMSFDKTTQTVWFSSEKAGAVSQFDPATGKLKIVDFTNLLGDTAATTLQANSAANATTIFVNDKVAVNAQLSTLVNGVLATVNVTSVEEISTGGPFKLGLAKGFTTNLSAGTQISVRLGDNPHGAFFDFNTHLTPRVFVAHRNAGGNTVGQGGSNESDGRLTYIDINAAKGKVVSFDFELVKNQILPSGVSVKDFLESKGIHDGFLPAFHAAFVDATGDVWISTPDAHSLLQFDFDYTEPGCGLECTSTNLTIHPIPEELRATFKVGATDVTQEFHPHAFQVVVDERTLEKWVWALDVAGSGRIALMRPSPSGSDQWTTWDVGTDFEAVAGTFVQIDDNETPGTPQDDFIVATFPAAAGTDGKPSNSEGTKGFVHRFSLLDPQNTRTSGTRMESWVIPKISGANAATSVAAANQPFVDRSGRVFVIDRFGGVVRFHANEFDTAIPNVYSEQIIATAKTQAIDSIRVGVLKPTSVLSLSPMVTEYTLDPQTEIRDLTGNGLTQDRASIAGFDQYEVSGLNPNNSLVAARGPGAFRGALNASSVLYGSLAQAEKLSVSVFAETTRRQLSVVTSPFAAPIGAIVEARMAFQVVRDGSLLMTSRGDGKIRDKQINLLTTLFDAGRVNADELRKLTISGDVSSSVGSDNKVYVMGRSLAGGVVVYTFTPDGNDWQEADLNNPSNWTIKHRPINGHVLAADISSADSLGFSVTTAAGHWLAISLDGTTVQDLTVKSGDLIGGRVYSVVGVAEHNGKIYGYGSNQTGNLVEYTVAGNSVSVRVIAASGRDTRILQNVEVLVGADGVRHVFGTDGVSRLVHYQIEASGTVRPAVNVTQSTVDSGETYGYFDFQKQFAGRVYTYVEPVLEADGTIRAYGTNGGDLVEFTKPTNGPWRVANLTQNTNATFGNKAPVGRVPANFVFGAPSAYIDSRGGRHVLQINASAEVVEYYTYGSASPAMGQLIRTQNINLANGIDPATLFLKNHPVIAGLLGNGSSGANGEAEDVNQDGVVSAIDVLTIINHINQPGPAGEGEAARQPLRLDVSGDSLVSAVDVLMVINYINRRSRSAEGETAISDSAVADNGGSIALDLWSLEEERKRLSLVDGFFDDLVQD